jgi:MFS family permease
VQFVLIGALDVLFISLSLRLGLREATGGLFMAALTVGTLVGSTLLATRFRTRVFGALAFGSALLALAFAVAEPIGKPLVFVVVAGAGLAYATVDLAARTLLPRSVPAALLGRVYGLQESAVMFGAAIGAAAVPVLLRLFGLTVSLAVVGALPALLVLARHGALSTLDSSGVEREGLVRLISRTRCPRWPRRRSELRSPPARS